MLKGSGHIALPLDECFLDFSALDTKDNQDLDRCIQEQDCGPYHPPKAVEVIKPLLPLSLKTPMERKADDDARFEAFCFQKEVMQTFIREKKEKAWSDFFKKHLIGIDLWTHEEVHKLRQLRWNSEQKSANEKFEQLRLPPSEQLVYLFKCCLATGSSVSAGTLFFTQRHLIFLGKVRDDDVQNKQRFYHKQSNLRITIPLRNVLSFHRAKLMVPAKIYPEHFFTPSFLAKAVQPAFVGVGEGEEDDADSLMVFTNDHCVHNFFGFDHFLNHQYNDMLAVFDHTWRCLAEDKQKQNEITPMFTIDE